MQLRRVILPPIRRLPDEILNDVYLQSLVSLLPLVGSPVISNFREGTLKS
jgi:hypothetical protein